MLKLILGWVIPLAIRFGVEWVIGKFPGIPEWVKDVLRRLEDEKKAASAIEDQDVKLAEHVAAKRRAVEAVKAQCSGVACPPDLKVDRF
jgi:hypothetical protein